MRPDLPWNVAGISSEAREAARAAARREGLSVGEWLTRRIVSSMSDANFPHAGYADYSGSSPAEFADMSASRNEWPSRNDFRVEPDRQRRDSDAMLDRVSKSEADTAEVYRRIEDQLRNMARRLDSSERSQTESNRVVSKAAVEMNIVAREQAQAFDQLGAHVTNLADRLGRVEERDPGDGLRDAVKALHLGLTRLADQITETANQSAMQISNLANNIECVAGRVSQSRQESLAATQALESRLAVLDERVRAAEGATQAQSGSINRALEAIDAQRRAPSPMDAIIRLEDSVHRLEERGSDPGIDRRLMGIERSLSDVMTRIEQSDEPSQLEENLKKVVARLDSLEATQREIAAELRKAEAPRAEAPLEIAPPLPPVVEPVAPPPFAPPPAATMPPGGAGFAPLPGFDSVPFAAAAPFASAQTPSTADPLPNYEMPPEAFAPDPTDVPPSVESYLAAARRSARVAAQQESERSAALGTMRWGAAAKAKDVQPQRTRPLVVGLMALLAIAVIGAAILSRTAKAPTPVVPVAANVVHRQPVVLPPQSMTAAETPQAAPDLHTGAPNHLAAKPAPSGMAAAKPITAPAAQPPAVQPPGQQAPSSQISGPQTRVGALPPTPNRAPLDRLTQAANSGNAKAQLIVGLKYLEDQPSNDTEAAKWLTKAAEAGEPVAEYRLGTLYERGKGVTADAAKAARWYQAAANHGSRKAMHNLAVAYSEGAGLKKDFTEASRWFLKAANLGLKDSQFNLAVLYERGLGVPQNLVDAYKWYAIAAAQGDSESKNRMTAITSQLDNEARGAAQHAADSFKPGQLDARANVAPTVTDVTRG